MSIERVALDIVSDLYALPIAASTWPQILTRLKQAHHSQAAVIFIEEASRGPVFAVQSGYTKDDIGQYLAHFGHLDEAMIKLKKNPRPMALNTDYVEPAQLERSEFYCDFHRPLDLFYAMGSLTQLDGYHTVFIGLEKSIRSGGFEPDDKRLFELLVPHIRQALALQQQFHGFPARAALDVLERLSLGVIIASRLGIVLFVNTAATTIADQCDGISLGGRTVALSAFLSSETRQLHKLIADAASTSCGLGLGAGGALRISRPSGRPSYAVRVMPLSPIVCPEPAALVTVSDPQAVRTGTNDILSQLFGLTTAEARLAGELGAGCSLKDAARCLGITINTARTQLHQIFAKTETGRQSELARLLSQLAQVR
jgi:DNA-binding CsgD family transcriptional regulator